MKPFLALITPLSGDEHPEHPIVLPPTPPEQRPPWWPGHPEHPIPPTVGGGPIIPPDYGTWPPQRPPHPAHPIVTPPPTGGQPPSNPPGIWGGGNEPFPTPPIVIPPIPKPPVDPPVIWPGPGPLPNPDHPINKPPSPAPPGYDWYLEYLPLRGGWVWVLGPEGASK